MLFRFGVVLALALATGTDAAWAQCSDGMPPPCLGARRPAPRRPVPDSAARAHSFLLLPFRNIARVEAQEWLVEGSALMLADALGRFRDLNVVPEEQVLAARRRLGIASGVVPDANQMRRLAEETGGWTAVTGNILVTGGRMRIAAVAIDASNGQVLVRGSVDTLADADVRVAYDQLATQLLQLAGVSGQAEGGAARSTSSLDAYRAYVRGVTLLQQSAYRRANEAFTEAVGLDSTFAIAWARLALSSAAWNIGNLINPSSPAYRASERAAALASRLPPRLAAAVRAQSAFFRGRLGQARAIGDSLLAADIDDVDVRELLAMLEMLDPRVDTSGGRARMLMSPNRAVTFARDVLERDPGRRFTYSVFGYLYGLAAGMWGGTLAGNRGEGQSYAALMMGANEIFMPVLRESFAVMPRAAYLALPESERSAARRRAAAAGAQWMQRWIAAGPDDAEAYMWASRFAELQDSLPQALRYAEAAEARGVETEFEPISGRRLMLLMRIGRYTEAGVLAESLAAAGRLTRPFVPVIERGFAYGTAALLTTGRIARAAALATASGPGTPGRPACQVLVQDFRAGTPTSLSEEVVRAAMYSVSRNVVEVAASPVLRPCLLPLLTSRTWPGETGRVVAQRMLVLADSVVQSGDTASAFSLAAAAWNADDGVGPRLLEKRWFAERERQLAIGSRFLPSAAFVDGDSVTFAWEMRNPGPFTWDIPGIAVGWSMEVRLAASAPDSQVFTVGFGHASQPREAAATGGIGELIAGVSGRAVTALYQRPTFTQVSGAIVPGETGFRLVVRGDLASELRRLRIGTAVFRWAPCLRWETRNRECPSVSLPMEYR